MEEELRVIVSMPSENNNRRSSVLPFRKAEDKVGKS